MAYLEPPPPPIVAGNVARVRQVAASEDEIVNRKMRRRMEDRWRWPKKPPVFETHSAVVLGDDVTFGQRKVHIGNRMVLSAAAGDRVWKSVLKKMNAAQERALNEEFRDRRALPSNPLEIGAASDDIPFAIDMRNGVNFYHFMTEALPQLALISQIDSRAPIFMHLPVLSNLKGFVRKFVEGVFPKEAPRINFTDKSRRYAQVRFVFNHRHFLYQVGDPRIDKALAALEPDDPWSSIAADRRSRKFLLKNTYDTGMKALRRHVLKMIGQQDLTRRPNRIWIGRDLSRSNPRPNDGEDILLAELSARDFEVVYLERMSPLEQIATISSANQIIGPHGAAFAHMMFARETASVIEIATPQVQIHRWGDFLGNAHVSSCRYSTVFADVQGADNVANVPPITDGLRGIKIGEAARGEILNLVDGFVSQADAEHALGTSKSRAHSPAQLIGS